MHTTRFALTFALAAGIAAAQQDSPGITVDLNGATLLHRSPVTYVQGSGPKTGTVAVEVTLDASGNVNDARILSGPDELRRPVLQSVLAWHFASATAGAQRQVTVSFKAPMTVEERVTGAVAQERAAQARELVRQAEAKFGPRTLQSVEVLGLEAAQRDDLLARLPVRAGSSLNSDVMEQVTRAVREFDEHMVVSTSLAGADGVLKMVIGSPEARMKPRALPPTGDTAGRISVGGNVQQAKLISQPRPVYPPAAKEARIQGVVKLQAVIGKDGAVQQLEVLSGHPLLVQSSLEAVQQWTYQRTLLNGAPVEVTTQIDVNYTLSQ